LHQTHLFVVRFHLNPDWRKNDPLLDRWKLVGAAAQPDDYVTQHISWMEFGECWSDLVPALEAGFYDSVSPPEREGVAYGRLALYKRRIDSNAVWSLHVARSFCFSAEHGASNTSTLSADEDWVETLARQLGGEE
jgi:hypothetical protein